MYLGMLVAFNSKTLYVIPKNRLASGVALIFSSLVQPMPNCQIYAGIFAFIYYNKYINVGRLEHRRREMEERRQQQPHESQEMQVLKETYRTSVAQYK